MRRRFAFASSLLLLACSRSRVPSGSDGAPPEPVSGKTGVKWFDSVDAYPGARALCDEHVMAAPGAPPGDAEPIREIHWVSFATKASQREVASFYASRGMPLGGEHTHRSGRIVLEVQEVAEDMHPSCSEKPRAGEKSVIVVSRALP